MSFAVPHLGRQQQGLTLMELLVAIALTLVLSLLIAAVVQGWQEARTHLAHTAVPPVLEFCLLLEQSLDALVPVAESNRADPSGGLDWQASPWALEWLALRGWPPVAGITALQPQRLHYQADIQTLVLSSRSNPHATRDSAWQMQAQLDSVTHPNLQFYYGQRWQAQPAGVKDLPVQGLRLTLQQGGLPYVCTFSLPDLRP